MVQKSLAFDAALLGTSGLNPTTKARMVADKYWALAKLMVQPDVTTTVGAAQVSVRSASDLGTLQSTVVDFHDEVVALDLVPQNRPTIVDVGANIGQFCLAAKLFFPTATVLSFEPDPSVYEQLVANTKALGSVHTWNIGLGSASGVLKFHRHALSLMSSFLEASGEEYLSDVDLPVERLDDVLSDVPWIDLLKIDVEGFEYEVLAGAESILHKTAAVIVEVRLGPQPNGQRSNLDVIDLLQRASPSSHLLKTGRTLSDASGPTCLDIVVKLR